MAKEMMIVFIYDTTRCRKEEDDPAEALLYFHPAWVSPTQRLALAGQLMGIHQFLTTTFSPPTLITLQGGKFVLKKFNHYIVAIGTDRNIQNWILERRGNYLESILKLFHCDLDTINQSLNNDRNKFTEKLYQMLETYLPILQYSSNLFSSIPMIKLPKSASNVFLESLQLLQYCQETPGIIGGAIFYNNKVISTQLTPELTKQLVITDPYRIKPPAEKIITNFHLPLGVQLLRVYIDKKSFSNTTEECQKNGAKKWKKINTGMKRDSSRIFTVPEESEDDGIITTTIRKLSLPIKQEYKPKTRIQHPLTPSVCSTPLKDINRFLHDTAVLICNTTDSPEIIDKKIKNNIDDIPDIVKESLRYKRLNKLRTGFIDNKKKFLIRKTTSLSDIDKSLETPEIKKYCKKNYYNTISDPCYPVFKFDGTPLSQNLYNYYISCHYQELIKEPLKVLNNDFNISKKYNGIDYFSDFDTMMMNNLEKSPLDVRIDDFGKKRKDNYRRCMSLPLKSLNAPLGDDDKCKLSDEDIPVDIPMRKKLEGLQLTPLMSKLSILANDDRTSGFSSKETTPSEYYDLSSRLNKNNYDDDYLIDRGCGLLEKCELFICGHQNMVMVLLMDDGTGNDPELIHNLWETCMNNLGLLENKLGHFMEPMPSSEHKELYSVLSVDPDWDTMERTGLWGVRELEIAGIIHDRFEGFGGLTDVIVRTEDTVVYGNRCGRIEVFYQQGVGGGGSGGLPTPADLMGVVPLKAKRRLERDHGIVIL